jgi:NADH-quinone oxidoreductase subunit M
LFLLFTMASVGLPGTSGFVGEFLSLVGAYQASSLVAVVATTGIILGAAYMLYLYWRVAYGKLVKEDVAAMPDLNKREYAMLASIAAVVLWMGVYPESFMAPMRKDVGVLLARIDRAKPAGDAQLAKGSAKPAGDRHGAHAAPGLHGAPAAGAGAH